MSNMNIRYLLWHVNGTLFDTFPAVTYSFSKALSEMGFSVALNVIDGLVRQSFDDCLETLSGRFKLDSGLVRQKFAEFYGMIPPANQPPFAGAREVCEFIYQNGGLNIALTDCGMESTRRLLEAHQFSAFITDVLSLKQSHHEPRDPSILMAVLEKCSLNPAETLLIGARNLEIKIGQAVGVRTCLFGKAEMTVVTDIQIETYSQLLSLLKGVLR